VAFLITYEHYTSGKLQRTRVLVSERKVTVWVGEGSLTAREV
jgi:hypothetical protein